MPSADGPARPVDLTLARTHLRLGALALARTELEILAGQGRLDLAGRVDLAEVRWRLGDLVAAGEAATAALGSGEDDPMALTIAAEAAAAAGRPNEARRLASQALERATRPIDDLFAGMPRSAVWPADPAEPPPVPSTLFHHEPEPISRMRVGDTDPAVISARARPTDGEAPATPHGDPVVLGFWDGDASEVPLGHLHDPADELDAARAAAASGAIDEAALRFALVLRVSPALAPAVLGATDGLTGPSIGVVRGDAYRLVGLEAEAQRAYAAAAWSGARDRRRGNRGSDGSNGTGDEASASSANGI